MLISAEVPFMDNSDIVPNQKKKKGEHQNGEKKTK